MTITPQVQADLYAYTTRVLRARDAYYSDQAVEAGLCGTCGLHPCEKGGRRKCSRCRNERRVAA